MTHNGEQGADIVSALMQRCQEQPEAIAVRCGTQSLNYAQLMARSRALAYALALRGAKPGTRVAVLLPRGVDLVVSLVAVHLTGAAYLPIDDAYPPERISYVLEESGAVMLVSISRLAARIPLLPPQTLCLDEDAVAIEAAPSRELPKMGGEDVFYVIYTSGSTGKPKGALLPLRGPLNQYQHYRSALNIQSSSRFLIISSIGFDLTQRNLWAPLMAGGCVVLLESSVYDANAILTTIAREGITHLCCTPSAFYPLIEDPARFAELASLRELALGGEGIQLARLSAWRANPHGKTRLSNCYGPTETSANVALFHLAHGAAPPAGEGLPIGTPIANTRLYVLDGNLQALATGSEGELCIAGVGVALGYHNRPELTAERFVADPEVAGAKMYRTGDRARLRSDGLYEVLGRFDDQVKVRGVRIELGEVEAALAALPGVQGAAAAVRDDRLCAYLVAPAADVQALRSALAAQLPEAYVPTAWTLLDRLPLNAHGKLDRKALPNPSRARPPLAIAHTPPQGALETWLAEHIGALVGCEGVGRDDPFFELGGSSLTAVRLVAQTGAHLGVSLPVIGFFSAPTAAAYAAHLGEQHSAAVQALFGTQAQATAPAARRAPTPRRAAREAGEAIAIVGMATRLPGADTLDQFWHNLKNGTEAVRDATEAELDAAGISAELRSNPLYVKRTVTLQDPDCFDAAFFGYTPREAELMDPQQRIFLECAHAALEHAGHDPARAGRRIGVFGGVSRNSYFQNNLAGNSRTRALLPEVQITYSNDKDYIATRVSYKLDLHGPALTAQTACSTSGVLMHLARQSLLNGECDAAIVGGARVVCPLHGGYLWVDGSIMSRDGRMRAFDAEGSGMIRSSGTAAVVLKRLSDAQAAGDLVYAVIRGSALNNDSAGKAAYSAPSVAGQAEVIRAALDDAGVSADSISYVDAHGTSTYLGDPIEITALTQAYRQDSARSGYCRIGSSKSNVGHLDSAAGVVSVIKTALMLHHRALVPSAGYEKPNPNIDFAHSPFTVAAKHETWESQGPRRAGVSSFGIGGTNAHLVLEQAPDATQALSAARTWQLLPLSAKSEATLDATAQRHAAWWAAHPQASLADAAWTLQTGRSLHSQRGFILARSAAEAATRFTGETFIKGSALAQASLVFVFPGQGAQHPGMGRDLYDSEPLYRAVVDEGCEILKPLLGLDLRSVLYPAAAEVEGAATQLKQTVLAQPAIFLVSYALAKLWDSLGIRPTHMVGHSVGEFVAATLAGVFSFRDALGLLAARARLMQSMPGGSMMAVRLAEADTRALLPEGIALAALNAPALTIVSGPTPAMDAFEAAIKDQNIGAMRLHTSHAFHSAMMEPIVAQFAAEVAKVPRAAPQIPITSTLTGEPLSAEQAQDPHYWARQLREAVRFAPAITAVLAQAGRVLLEVGPGQSLSGPLRQISAAVAAGKSAVVSSAPPAGQENASATDFFAQALGRLWNTGIEADWLALHGKVARRKMGLPTYAFARTRHWVSPDLITTDAVLPADANPAASAATPTPANVAAAGDPVRERALGILSELTGLSFSADDDAKSFLDLGMDSLLLTQVAGKLKSAFKVDLRFRQLLEEFNTVGKLLDFLRTKGKILAASGTSTAVDEPVADDGTPKKSFGAGVRISKEKDVLAPAQRRALEAFIRRYVAKTGKSKSNAQQHRRYFADPRTVSGFKPMWKELVYPIISTRSEGAHLWDVDGHQYIDTINGFGATFFGHQPPFVNAAVKAQLDRGYEIGPTPEFIGDCAERFTRMVKLERVAFCNTGSEAVSAAQRCARTATGKDLIASFVNDYHGVHDEVIVRAGPGGKGLPAAGGIPNAHTSQTLILDYGDPKSLEILRNRADDLAAVMIEPIQSRNQNLQPREFIHGLRELCTQAGCAFIVDEVITGFRLGQGGAQEFFGVKADLASYGKVFGGGLPIGAVAGVPKFMDALDGGWWQFGDGSVPEAGVTYFAGTFVRHPLSMAAVQACLMHMEANPGLQAEMNQRIGAFVQRLRAAFAELGAPIKISTYTSIFRFEVSPEEAFGELLAHYFRLNGVHTYDHRNQVMTTCHTDAILNQMFDAYLNAVRQMQADGLLGRTGMPVKLGLADTRPGAIWYAPPMEGARLGRDAEGNPAWFVSDPAQAGRYLQIEEAA